MRYLAAAGWLLLAAGVAVASLTITLALCRAASGDHPENGDQQP